MTEKPLICHMTSAHSRCDVRIFQKQCQSLVEADYRVLLFVADGLGDEKSNSVEIIDVGRSCNRLHRMVVVTASMFWQALMVRGIVYHIHDPELLPWALLLKLIRRRVVFDAHEDYSLQILSKNYINVNCTKFVSYFYKKFENFICRHFDYVVAATPAIARNFTDVGCNVVTVCNFPIANEFLNIELGRSHENVVCYVGGFAKVRGILQILEATSLTKASVNLYLAGDCLDSDFEVEFRSHIGWSAVTDFGFVDRDGVSQIYENSNLGIVTLLPIPNYLEALPVKMFEYMAAGLPVIASNFPTWKHIVEEARCGICVDPENPSEIAKAIDYLLSHPTVALEMGKNGRKAVADLYNWDNERAKLIAMYDRLTA